MKQREAQPFIPQRREETVRRLITKLLKKRELSAKEISGEAGVSEREVFDHISHIRKSVSKKETGLTVRPARCRKCGFTFRKRERLRKPGKCPLCRSESIDEPLFSIK